LVKTTLVASKISPFETPSTPWLVKLPPPRTYMLPVATPASIVPVLTITSLA